MKKLLIIVLMCVAFASVKAQSTLKSTFDLASDTVTNTGTVTLSVLAPGSYNKSTVQIAITKISGTVGGTVTLQGSLDGVTYGTLDTTTYTATDVAGQSKIWVEDGNPVRYYRVSYAGTGTMSAIISAKLYQTKDN